MGQAKAAELATGKTIEQRVEEELVPEKLRVEVRKDGKWVDVGNANLE